MALDREFTRTKIGLDASLMGTQLAGIAIGAGAMNILQAQGVKKAAYVIANVEVMDPAGFQSYVAKVPDMLKPFSAQTIARGKPKAKEGIPPNGSMVIIAFGSLTAHLNTPR